LHIIIDDQLACTYQHIELTSFLRVHVNVQYLVCLIDKCVFLDYPNILST